jgi:microcin C transport system permease protein
MRARIHAHWLDPITRKRLRRFRQRRRAWISLCLLVALYAVSLLSELLCNDRPLYMRYRGRSFFPVVRFYPESAFIENGRNTRTDYLELEQTPGFRADPGRIVLWPPVKCGPNTSIDPRSLSLIETVALDMSQARRAGYINVDRDLLVVSSVAAGFFFGTNDEAMAGLSLADLRIPDTELKAAIDDRLANRAAGRFSKTVAGTGIAGIEVSVPEYVPRSIPPARIRITLRESPAESGKAWSLSLRRDGSVSGRIPGQWHALEESARSGILDASKVAFSTGVSGLDVVSGGTAWRADLKLKSVSWPHPPARGHWLGIDSAGRDVLARILYGMRTSLTFGLLLVAVTMTLGTAAGAIQGYYGGITDITGQRLLEIWSAMPFLYVMILMGSVFGRGFGLLLFCYAIFNWIGISYYMRAEFLRLRNQPFVDAARCMGIPDSRIITRHIIPNALTPLITFFPFYLVGAIGSLAALDYLGFGLPPPTPSWGELLNQAQQFRWAWWLILYPSLALFAVMVLGVFVGEGVRDAFDPRPLTRMEPS